MLKKNVDANELSQLSAKIATSETKASEHYDQLLSRYPNNVRGLRDYARFVDEMLNDNKTAQKIWAKADKLEEIETAKATSSYRGEPTPGNSNTPGMNTDPGMVDEEVPVDPVADGSSAGMSDPSADHDDFSDGTSHADGSSDTSQSSGFTRSLDQAHEAKTADLKRLSWIMFFTSCVAVMICVVQVAVLTSQLKQYTTVLEQLQGATTVGYQSMQLTCAVLDAAWLSNQTQQGNPNPVSASGLTLPETISTGKQLAYNIGNIVKALYWGSSTYDYFKGPRFVSLQKQRGMKVSGDASLRDMSYDEFSHKGVSKQVKSFMEKPEYKPIDYASDPGYVSYMYGNYSESHTATSFWRLTMSYTQQSQIMFGLPASTLGSPPKMMDYAAPYNFLLANPVVYQEGAIKLAETLRDKVLASNNLLVIIAGALLAVAVISLVSVAATLFRIVVRNIFDHKMKTLHLFAMIPRKVVRIMLKKKTTLLGQTGDTTEEEEKGNVEVKKEVKIKEKKRDKKHKKSKEYVKARPDTPKVVLSSDADDEETRDDVAPAAPREVADENGELRISRTGTGDVINEENADAREEVEYGAAVINILPAESSISNVLIPLLPIKESKDKEIKGEKKGKTAEESSSSDDDVTKKKKSRIDTRSIGKVVQKLHLSYIVAIALFVICFVVSFILERNSFVSMNSVSQNVQNSALRLQYMRTILYDVSLYAYYDINHPLAVQANADADQRILDLMAINSRTAVPNDQMSLFFRPRLLPHQCVTMPHQY